jgi:hypothetical protein
MPECTSRRELLGQRAWLGLGQGPVSDGDDMFESGRGWEVKEVVGDTPADNA